jgi:hypothetical protein
MLKTMLIAILLLAAAPTIALAQPKSAPGKLTPALCEMLGMADEYMSRFDFYSGQPRPGFVEQFYPHERTLADAYEKLIAVYAKESGARLEHERQVLAQGHVVFKSSALADLINSFYVKADARVATLAAKHILQAPRACQLRYLQGAYRRYSDKDRNVIRMANALHKVTTIGRLLKQLGCKTVTVYTTRTIPGGTVIFFVPDAKVARLLPIKQQITESELAAGLKHGEVHQQL